MEGEGGILRLRRREGGFGLPDLNMAHDSLQAEGDEVVDGGVVYDATGRHGEISVTRPLSEGARKRLLSSGMEIIEVPLV